MLLIPVVKIYKGWYSLKLENHDLSRKQRVLARHMLTYTHYFLANLIATDAEFNNCSSGEGGICFSFLQVYGTAGTSHIISRRAS